MFKYIIPILIGLLTTLLAQSGVTFKVQKFTKTYVNPQKKNEKFIDFSLEYPVFSGVGEAANTAKFLNQQVAEILLENESSPESLFNKFVKDHKEIYSDGSGMGMEWSLQKKLTYDNPTHNIGTLTSSGYSYLGGAHGGSWVNYFNYDLQKNNLLTLNEVMNPNFLPKLTAEGEKIFRKLKNLKPNQTLEGEYWFENNKFHLNENYLFTKKGITFFYNEYEITCYACGTTELTIPYKNIKSLINKNGLLKSFLN